MQMPRVVVLIGMVSVVLLQLQVPLSAQESAADPAPAAKAATEKHAIIIERAAQDAVKAAAAAQEIAKATEFHFVNVFDRAFKNHELDAKIRQASAQVRDANDEATRVAATTELTSLLDKYFEEDLKIRQKELEDIAARLDKLRAQLDRRRQRKQEIIDLQVKVAVNEADGLGFYSRPAGGGEFKFDVHTPVMVSPGGHYRVYILRRSHRLQ